MLLLAVCGRKIIIPLGESSGKAEDEGVAGSYVGHENTVRGIIWLAVTHGYLEAQRPLSKLSNGAYQGR
jgi:hypothetical protein